MSLRPQKHYFLVRIDREAQRNREEKVGSIYLPPTYVGLTRCMENAEIVAIGERAKRAFPEAKVGDKLIMHHFVEGMKDDITHVSDFMVDSDERYNYYVVAASDYNGERNYSYGIYDGEKIIPSKDYVFLEVKAPEPNRLPQDELLKQATTMTKGGLFIFREWRTDRADKEERMKNLEQDNLQLAGNLQNPRIDEGRRREARDQIQANESEIKFLSRQLNKHTYEPFEIAYCNKEMDQWFARKVKPGDILYVMNFAAKTITEFMGKNYIVAPTEYVGFMWD